MMRMKMDRKEYGDVKEIAESISAKDLKARISRLRRDASRPLSARDECEVYAHIRRLKKEFEVEFEDPYLVFKECCSHEVMGEDGSFVFKTSKSALEIAAKMSGARKHRKVNLPTCKMSRHFLTECTVVFICTNHLPSGCTILQYAKCCYWPSWRLHERTPTTLQNFSNFFGMLCVNIWGMNHTNGVLTPL